MDANKLIDGLLLYIGFVVITTFHEFGHAWMAMKCGDDTAKQQGRISLNPIVMVQMNLIGALLVPLLAILISASGSGGTYLIGWATTPVVRANLRNPRLDDILVSLAGPWMNLLVAAVLFGLMRLAMIANADSLVPICKAAASLSLFLFFLNLLPIPPLDGAHVVSALVGMSEETFRNLSRFSVLALILVLNIPDVRRFLGRLTVASARIMAGWFGIESL